MTRNEEMVYRELKALAGDLDQIATNMERDFLNRERIAAERTRFEASSGGPPRLQIGMMNMDRQALSKDLLYINRRLHSLFSYL